MYELYYGSSHGKLPHDWKADSTDDLFYKIFHNDHYDTALQKIDAKSHKTEATSQSMYESNKNVWVKLSDFPELSVNIGDWYNSYLEYYPANDAMGPW